MKRECLTCEWYDVGSCHRLPPQMPPWPNDNQHPIMYMPTATWPHVNGTDWCGEYRAHSDRAGVVA